MSIFFSILIFLFFLPLSASDVILIGIAGGTGSGKTTLAEKIQAAFPQDSVLINQDSYYRDLSSLPPKERDTQNFDHPNAIDFALLKTHLKELIENRAVEVPIYSFESHTRRIESRSVIPARLIIVEGILLFTDRELADLFELKIFIATDDDIRLLRRIDRDMRERGRDFEGIKEQYLQTVKPMHEAFVEPSKKLADVIIPEGGYNEKGLSFIIANLNELLKKN